MADFWQLNIGQVLVAGSMVLSIVIIFTNMRSDIKNVSVRMAENEVLSRAWRVSVDSKLEKQTEILVELGKQDQRLDEHERRFDELMRRIDTVQALGHLSKSPSNMGRGGGG